MTDKLKKAYEMLTPQEKITTAKARLFKKEVFWISMLQFFKFIETREVYLAAIDMNGNLYWNPDNVNKLTLEELEGLLAHELYHEASKHTIRRGNRNSFIWNWAIDAIVNFMMTQSNISLKYDLPKEGIIPDIHGFFKFELINKSFTFNVFYESGKNNRSDKRLKSPERLYEDMMKELKPDLDRIQKELEKLKSEILEKNKNQKQQQEGQGEGQGIPINTKEIGNNPFGFDDHITDLNGIPPTEEEREKLNRKKTEQIIKAKHEAQRIGTISAGLKRMLDEILENKINWRQHLYKYINERNLSQHNWLKPNKRGLSMGVYLPKRTRESLDVVFHIDTSGSMNDKSLKESLGELQGILNQFKNVNIQVLIGDTQILEIFELTSTNSEDIFEIAKNMKGGGGTSHIPVFKHVEDVLDNTKILICFTDGYTDFPKETEYSFDTLWIITENGIDETQIPFGEVIKIKEEF